jgi:ABC-type antimicrobial peptide transport system permease subunit
MWILKSRLGGEVEMEDDHGRTVKLRIVGLLRRSIFQSELLISEQQVTEHFPSVSGYSYFLVDAPAAGEERVAAELEETLRSYGFDVTSTAHRLQSFQAVENTYLSTFQTLGGLGLLLGTVGLAVILLRSVLERRGELATMRALGFRRRALAFMVVAENGLLLLVGVAVGTVAALVAVAPHLAHANALVPWGALAATLVLIVAVGTLAALAAVRQALRVPLLPALRAE